jgi:N-acyl-D-amino-acid deacylase
MIIRGGTVHDGLGSEPVTADVLIEDGRIAAIRDLAHLDAPGLDASGCLVTPGFIDIHSHSDFTVLVDPRAVSSVHQGVTTEVVGNCGFGCFPIRDAAAAGASIYGFRDDVAVDWQDAAGYFARLETARPAVNVLSLVPNAQLRISTMAEPAAPASREQVSTMARKLREALDAGAWGYSTGLEYPVEEHADDAELATLARIAADSHALYATHTRDRGGDGVAGVQEAIRTARAAGVRLQISHLLPRGGDGERVVALVEQARADGLDVAFDQHTRAHGFTYLRVARRLFGDAFERMIVEGRDLASLAAERGQDPRQTLAELVQENPKQTVSFPAYTPEQQRDIFAHPLCVPASDATALAPDGPLAHERFDGAYTWAAWYWRAVVRDWRALTPQEAIHRLTGRPAATLGLRDRGTLRPGARADVAVFAPFGFAAQPSGPAAGMRHVLVNGALTLCDGALTGTRAGEVLRR